MAEAPTGTISTAPDNDFTCTDMADLVRSVLRSVLRRSKNGAEKPNKRIKLDPARRAAAGTCAQRAAQCVLRRKGAPNFEKPLAMWPVVTTEESATRLVRYTGGFKDQTTHSVRARKVRTRWWARGPTTRRKKLPAAAREF